MHPFSLRSNAIKFTDDGGRITVTARPRDTRIELAVTDTGIGMTPTDVSGIFEKFRQVGARQGIDVHVHARGAAVTA